MRKFFNLRIVKWENGRVLMIDQKILPQRLRYLAYDDYRQVVKAIRNMAVRGAPAIGAAAGMALALAAYHSHARGRKELIRRLEEAALIIKSTRPTAINLSWALDRVLGRALEVHGDVEEVKDGVIKEAKLIADEDVSCNKTLGKHGAKLLKDGDTILTHCNAGALATVGYGTALGVVRAAIDQRKKIEVIATETRPALQGARLTCFELQTDRIPVTLISDTMVGYAMKSKWVNKVIVGADRILTTGYVFNKIGTYQIAVLAKRHKIPFYSAAPLSTFDRTSKVSEVIIEERNPREVIWIGSTRIAPKGVKARYPAFDLTPPELVTGIITEKGVLYPPFSQSIRRALR
ncbi:MAG: S-methyl-5-thioribose-1-phosphate isomerase [Aigarchaeota archaeon]|nr:S-methyl-5-thioribose-1-phosphate isomerase [Aigarchaeota archaeon]